MSDSSAGKERLPSPIAALPSLRVGSSRSLHNVTYVTYVPPDCPSLPRAGEAPQPRPRLLLPRGGKSRLGSPLGIFPSGFGEWEPQPQALCIPAKRWEGEMLAAIAHLPPHAWLPEPGTAGQLLTLLPFSTASPAHLSPSFLSD